MARDLRTTPDPRLITALVAARACRAAGERDAQVIRDAMQGILAREPRAIVEYVSVADGLTLRELATVRGPALASLAVRFGDVRLFDNEPLGV